MNLPTSLFKLFIQEVRKIYEHTAKSKGIILPGAKLNYWLARDNEKVPLLHRVRFGTTELKHFYDRERKIRNNYKKELYEPDRVIVCTLSLVGIKLPFSWHIDQLELVPKTELANGANIMFAQFLEGHHPQQLSNFYDSKNVLDFLYYGSQPAAIQKTPFKLGENQEQNFENIFDKTIKDFESEEVLFDEIVNGEITIDEVWRTAGLSTVSVQERMMRDHVLSIVKQTYFGANQYLREMIKDYIQSINFKDFSKALRYWSITVADELWSENPITFSQIYSNSKLMLSTLMWKIDTSNCLTVEQGRTFLKSETGENAEVTAICFVVYDEMRYGDDENRFPQILKIECQFEYGNWYITNAENLTTEEGYLS